MDTAKTYRVLIVDDETENLEILFALLQDRYTVIAATSGEKALDKVGRLKPDLVLLDIRMPGLDGFEVCRRLKSSPETSDIPVIFVSAMSDTVDEARGFALGGVDYITKPVSAPIVRARVKNHLILRKTILDLKAAMVELKRLNHLALDANPMTKLPGNNSITGRIRQALHHSEAACVIYADLDYFKPYNDAYGFAMGDDVIRFTSRVLARAVEACDVPDPFIGHIGGDDFVIIVPSAHARATADSIIRLFDRGITGFYKPHDAAAGQIRSENRQGQEQAFPLISISLAGIDLSKKKYHRHLEVNDACVEAKKKAKTMPGSSFFLERRITPKISTNSRSSHARRPF